PPGAAGGSAPPRTPRTLTVPEFDDTVTSPRPVWVISIPPLPVFAVIGPAALVTRIDPLPVLACMPPAIDSAVPLPDPVAARSAPARRILSEPEPLCAST